MYVSVCSVSIDYRLVDNQMLERDLLTTDRHTDKDGEAEVSFLAMLSRELWCERGQAGESDTRFPIGVLSLC